METKFTAEDVEAAHYAQTLKALAATEKCSESSLIREDSEFSDVAALERRYERGIEVLSQAKLLMSAKSANSHPRESEFAGEVLLSPIVTTDSGHIASSRVWRFLALAERAK